MDKQHIALLGSTGSIGEQTLEIVRNLEDRFAISTLTAHNNWQRLASQAREFRPDSVVVTAREHYPALREALADTDIKVYAGHEAASQVVRSEEVAVVVNALVGYAGLAPTVAALEAGKKLALANKESLVAGGELVMRLARKGRVPVLPIDSEHSAILQCLIGETSAVEKIILTGSGGALRDVPLDALAGVSPERALQHPNWKMGNRITIDSATMLNKGFEVIEAHWLFGVDASRIEVLIHPQSVVHSMVEFADGAIKAQLGTPDMKLPIQYALTFPARLPLPASARPFDFAGCGTFTFSQADPARYPCLALAYEALRRGGNAGCVLNAAGEVAVAAFLAGRIPFTKIAEIVEKTLARVSLAAHPSLDDLDRSDAEARAIASEYTV